MNEVELGGDEVEGEDKGTRDNKYDDDTGDKKALCRPANGIL